MKTWMSRVKMFVSLGFIARHPRPAPDSFMFDRWRENLYQHLVTAQANRFHSRLQLLLLKHCIIVPIGILPTNEVQKFFSQVS